MESTNQDIIIGRWNYHKAPPLHEFVAVAFWPGPHGQHHSVCQCSGDNIWTDLAGAVISTHAPARWAPIIGWVLRGV